MKMKKRAWMVLVSAMLLALSMALTGCANDASTASGGPGENWWKHEGEAVQTEQKADPEWWSVLNDTWTAEDWEETEDGVWMRLDEETKTVYAYDEETQEFSALDAETQEVRVFDRESEEWVPAK